MTNLFSAGRPSSSALAASSRESMRESLCRIWANNSISLLRIACVSTASHGAETVNGWNGQRLTGNSSSTMCARDSSNLTGDCFWNSIGARTALHFSHQNCARFFESQGARIVRWKALLAADPNRAAAIQNGVAVALWATRPKGLSSSALRFAQRNGYNFQSEQSQPSSCSILEMSSANRL